MSYILDALRRADAERERDPSRGIHAQSAGALPRRPQRRSIVWVAPLAAVAVVVVAGFAWWHEPAPVQRAVAPVPPVGLHAVPAPAPVVVPVAAAVSPPAPPVPAPVVEKAPVEKTPVKVAAVLKAPAPAMQAASAAQSAASAAPPVADRILAQGELPADVQRDLPKLAISGGVHSDNAAQRMLIVGGQVMAEGAELAPGLVLEQIRARTAVLRFRGYRYSVSY